MWPRILPGGPWPLLLLLGLAAVASSDCPAGHYMVPESCKPCRPGHWSAAGDEECTECPRGRWSSRSGASACEACPAGTWSSAVGSSDVNSCSNCSKGTWGHHRGATSSDACSNCPMGRWSERTGMTSAEACESCGPGKWSKELGAIDEGLCMPCQPGHWSNSSSGSCTACEAGRWSSESEAASEDVCEPCLAGRYSEEVGAGSRSTCRPCGAGYWSDQLGVDSRMNCTACPAGRWSDISVAISDANCTACSPGRYSEQEGTSSLRSCLACPEGRYNGQAGQTECIPRAEVHYAGKAFLAPNGTLHEGKSGSLGDFLSLEKGKKGTIESGVMTDASTVAEFPPGSGPSKPSANLLRSRGVVIEVHNLTYDALSADQRERLARRFAADLAASCNLDLGWVTDPAGKPHTTYLAPSTDDPTTTFVSAELHVPTDTTDVARGCAMIAAGHFGVTISEFFDGKAPPGLFQVTTTEVTTAQPTATKMSDGNTVHLVTLEPEGHHGAAGNDGGTTTEDPNKGKTLGLRAGLLASFLVGLGTICVCCGSFLACLSGPRSKKRGTTCGIGDEESNSELEDSEFEATAKSAEVAPLLGVDKPSPPMSPASPKRTRSITPPPGNNVVTGNGFVTSAAPPPGNSSAGQQFPSERLRGPPSERSREQKAFLRGLDAPSGLEVQVGGMGVELPPIGSPVNTGMPYGSQAPQPPAQTPQPTQSQMMPMAPSRQSHGAMPSTQSFPTASALPRSLPSFQSSFGALAGPPSPISAVQAPWNPPSQSFANSEAVAPQHEVPSRRKSPQPARRAASASFEDEDGNYRKRVVRYELKSLSSPSTERPDERVLHSPGSYLSWRLGGTRRSLSPYGRGGD